MIADHPPLRIKTMNGVIRPALSLVLLVSVLVLVIGGYFLGLFESLTPISTTASPPDLDNHPIYSHYPFGRQDTVIDLGTQPLFLPGVISEVMRRDSILRSALAALGMEIRFHAFLKGADINFFIARGDLEAGIGGDMPTLLACADSNVLVASMIDQHFASMVARKSMMIPELKGKRIAYTYGSNAHYMLLETLASEGLGPRDLQLIPMDVSNMTGALVSGDIDVFAAWEPTPALAIDKHPELITINRQLTSGYLYFSRSFSEREPELVRQVIAAQLRAMMWLRARKNNLFMAATWALEASHTIWEEADPADAVVLAAAVNKGLLGISSSALINDRDLAVDGRLFQEFHFLQQMGEISANIDWKVIPNCFARNLVPDIISHAASFQLHATGYVAEQPISD